MKFRTIVLFLSLCSGIAVAQSLQMRLAGLYPGERCDRRADRRYGPTQVGWRRKSGASSRFHVA